MNSRLTVRGLAKLDLAESALWYDERRPGLGDELIAEVEAVYTQIRLTPERYPATLERANVHRARTRRFDFCVYYKILGGEIVVIAVLHAARDPATWQARA